MGIRSTVGSMLESSIGRERTNTIRRAERQSAQRASEGAGNRRAPEVQQETQQATRHQTRNLSYATRSYR